MRDVVIVDSVRTGLAKSFRGTFNLTRPDDMVAHCINALLQRNPTLDPIEVEDVIVGAASQTGEQGGNIARIAALYAGYDMLAPGMQVNRFCASGLVATNLAAARIMAGQDDCVIGGGVESMSRVPMGSSRGPWATDPQVATSTHFIPQGISADLLATLFGYSRRDCDTFAALSQDRAAAAWEAKRFAKSIVPVKDNNGVNLLDHDEHMRPGTTADSLAKLRASFTKLGQNYGFDDLAMQVYPEVERIDHVHHAGNSSGIVDGAAAILLGSKECGERNGLKPRAKMISFASIGSEPTLMLSGPADAAIKTLKRAGMSASDIDLWEINEAFAAVVLRFIDVLELNTDVVNVNGGAIAMGHPLGATGAMILGTVLDELERRDLSTGLAALCVGAGMGTATIIERC